MVPQQELLFVFDWVKMFTEANLRAQKPQIKEILRPDKNWVAIFIPKLPRAESISGVIFRLPRSDHEFWHPEY